MRPPVRLDLSGVRVWLSDLPEEMVDLLGEEWAPFLSRSEEPPFLHARIGFVDSDSEVRPFRPKLMRSSFEADRARFRMPEGQADVDETGAVRMTLVTRPGQIAYYTMHNLLRGCLAWRMPQRGGALLHAAGLVVGGRAFALVGPSGSGKTTWARLGRQAGATVIADDLLLLDGVGGTIEALGSPFRSFHVADYRPGRWPMGAILFPAKGRGASWADASPTRARSRILANLPFVSNALEQDHRVAEVIDRLAGEVPCRDLTFGLDGAFVDLLRSP